MSALPRWHTQRCGRCQSSHYFYGQRERRERYLLDADYLFGQNMTEHNPPRMLEAHSSVHPQRCPGVFGQGLSLSNRAGGRGPSDSCQPGRPFRQVRFTSHQPAKHWLGLHGCSWAVPRQCKACATPARHTGVCSRLCTASTCQNMVHGTCGSLGITNIGAQGRGEQ